VSANFDLMQTIKALHQARLDEGASLEVAARRIGVSAQALDQWERRQVLPRPEHIFAWAKAFGKRLLLVDHETAPVDLEVLTDIRNTLQDLLDGPALVEEQDRFFVAFGLVEIDTILAGVAP